MDRAQYKPMPSRYVPAFRNRETAACVLFTLKLTFTFKRGRHIPVQRDGAECHGSSHKKLRVGVQFLSRDLGETGNNEVEVDWAYGDYRFRNWLGIRAGKMKTDYFIRRLKSYVLSADRIYRQMIRDDAFIEDKENAHAVKTLGEEKIHLLGKLNEFSEIVRGELAQKIASVNASAKRKNDLNAMISSLVIGISVLIIFFLIDRAVTRPMMAANQKLEKAMDALWGEMELARKLQTCLLPSLSDNIHPDFEIDATMLPADEVGGDFYEVSLDRSGHLWFAIGDVSGHGVTPGLIMMMAQTVHTTVTSNLDCDGL